MYRDMMHFCAFQKVQGHCVAAVNINLKNKLCRHHQWLFLNVHTCTHPATPAMYLYKDLEASIQTLI